MVQTVMMPTSNSSRIERAPQRTPPATRVRGVLAELERRGSKATRDGMARYGIRAPRAFGVTLGAVQEMAKAEGRDHPLALALWDTGWYEAKLLACFVADPGALTLAQMDRWSRDFDNWAVVDTACMHLFNRCPHAWRKVDEWSRHRREFVRRAGFALLASMALHDKTGPHSEYTRRLKLIEEVAGDDRNFVKKAVSWALHALGTRSAELNEAAVAVARKLAVSGEPAERWVGNDALGKLTSAATRKRLAKTARK